MFVEHFVFGEVLVILVFSLLLRITTCKKSWLSQSATLLWPWIFAGFVLAEGRVRDKRLPVLRVIKCGVTYDIARWNLNVSGKTLTMCSVNLVPRVMCEVSE